MQSSIWKEAEAKGRDEGKLIAEREVCREMVKRYHPALLEDAAPIIESCADPARLKRWIVQAPELSDDEYRSLLDGRDGS